MTTLCIAFTINRQTLEALTFFDDGSTNVYHVPNWVPLNDWLSFLLKDKQEGKHFLRKENNETITISWLKG